MTICKEKINIEYFLNNLLCAKEKFNFTVDEISFLD